jgi:hypothetical protein
MSAPAECQWSVIVNERTIQQKKKERYMWKLMGMVPAPLIHQQILRFESQHIQLLYTIHNN